MDLPDSFVTSLQFIKFHQPTKLSGVLPLYSWNVGSNGREKNMKIEEFWIIHRGERPRFGERGKLTPHKSFIYAYSFSSGTIPYTTNRSRWREFQWQQRGATVRFGKNSWNGRRRLGQSRKTINSRLTYDRGQSGPILPPPICPIFMLTNWHCRSTV